MKQPDYDPDALDRQDLDKCANEIFRLRAEELGISITDCEQFSAIGIAPHTKVTDGLIRRYKKTGDIW